jgi:hypothetical protein
LNGKVRPSTAGRDLLLCGDEYGEQCVINSDGVIVMSNVFAQRFIHNHFMENSIIQNI